MRRRRRSRLERALAERRARNLAEARARSRRTTIAVTLLYIFTFAVIFVALTCTPRPWAHAATRVPVSFTVPAGARLYEAIARRPDDTYLAVMLSADSASATTLAPAAAGARQTGWVLISSDWRAGTWTVWVRACNTVGCAGWSNRTVHLAGVPDTVWMLTRGPGPDLRAPLDGPAAKRAAGRVGWGLTRADSVAAATIEHQEAVQLRERARLCELFGFWALRGGSQPCP